MMTNKTLAWITVIATVIVLSAPHLSALDKSPEVPAGISPRTVANHLQAVIMAHRLLQIGNVMGGLVISFPLNN